MRLDGAIAYAENLRSLFAGKAIENLLNDLSSVDDSS
jgi:hypothetical protein